MDDVKFCVRCGFPIIWASMLQQWLHVGGTDYIEQLRACDLHDAQPAED